MLINVELQFQTDGQTVNAAELDKSVRNFCELNEWKWSEIHFFDNEDKNAVRIGKDCAISIVVDGPSASMDLPTKINENDKLIMHIYHLHKQSMDSDVLEEDYGDGMVASVPCMNHYLLPNRMFKDLWQSLIYEPGVKEHLLQYATSALKLAQHKIKPEIITCNRLLLLHGPPGTGKTSLCKALAQKIAIRTFSKYLYVHLIEINSHSLFSKWFSESGKLVMRLFEKIRYMLEGGENLVCVLIDEVESLAFARDMMSNSSEPKDAMRVVNALLTQLDSLKSFENVFVFATSNLSDDIDAAFLDRADIKQYIGLPKPLAITCIYDSMVKELLRVGLVTDVQDYKKSQAWCDLQMASNGINGRIMRKLPFLAYPKIIQENGIFKNIPVALFFKSMYDALLDLKNENKNFKN